MAHTEQYMERIRECVKEWSTKTPEIRRLTKSIVDDYQKELEQYDYHKTTTAHKAVG